MYCSIEYPPPKLICPSSLVVELPPGESPSGHAQVRIGRTLTNVNWEKDIQTEPSWAKHRNVQLPKGFTNVTITATHPQSHLVASCSFIVDIIGELGLFWDCKMFL